MLHNSIVGNSLIQTVKLKLIYISQWDELCGLNDLNCIQYFQPILDNCCVFEIDWKIDMVSDIFYFCSSAINGDEL